MTRHPPPIYASTSTVPPLVTELDATVNVQPFERSTLKELPAPVADTADKSVIFWSDFNAMMIILSVYYIK
jgi:hypothetical protein